MVSLNGQIVPDDEARISVFDRCFLYGDGLFETLRVQGAQPFRCWQHLARLEQSAQVLQITLPFSAKELARQCAELIHTTGLRDAILRITLSRGVGLRGYSPRGAQQPVVVISIHSAPPVDATCPAKWRLVTSSFRIAAGDSLARLKTCNKLHQVMARAEAEAQETEEALLLNSDEEVIEGASANLFWVDQGTVCTPPVSSGALPGVTRAILLELCLTRGIAVREQRLPLESLRTAEGVFLTLTSLGIVEAATLDGQALSQSPLPQELHRAYQALMAAESGSTAGPGKTGGGRE